MADKLWEVFGTFTQNGVKKEYNNVFNGNSANDAKKAAMRDYNTYTRAGYEKATFGKLTITKVEPWTEEKRQKLLKGLK